MNQIGSKIQIRKQFDSPVFSDRLEKFSKRVNWIRLGLEKIKKFEPFRNRAHPL